MIKNITSLDSLHRLNHTTSSPSKAIGNNLFGIDHNETSGQIENNKDGQKLVFFTRPNLNLNTANIRNNPEFYDMLTKNKYDINHYVKCLLDPSRVAVHDEYCPLLDNELPFLSILSNNLMTLTGWPDETLPSFTSKPGLKGEQYIQPDGAIEIYNTFDLNATFRNTSQEPIYKLLNYYTKYMSYVFQGKVGARLNTVGELEKDYDLCIYVIILDHTKRYIKHIAAIGSGYPDVNPIGRRFDVTKYQDPNENTKEISVKFKCQSAFYNDPRLINDFNLVGGMFNPEINKLMDGEETSLEKIPNDLLYLFNNRGYPYINTKTMELEWYISKNSPRYKEIIKTYGKETNNE